MLCGKTMIQDNERIYKIVTSLEDSNKAYDQKEFDSLPSKAIKKKILDNRFIK